MSLLEKEIYTMILTVVANIPYGQVATYGQVARLAGLPRHARLVGYVLKHLDESSQLPWHRVINAQGRLSLKSLDSHGCNIQQVKLEQENIVVLNGQVKLKHYQWNA